MHKVRQARASWRARTLLATAAAALLAWGAAQAQQSSPPSKLPLPKADPPAKRIITQGPAKMVTEDLAPCANPKPGMNLRKNPVGEIVAQDGTIYFTDASTRFAAEGRLHREMP